MPSASPVLAAAIVGQNRVRDRRRRRVFIPFRDHHLHAVGCQHFQRTGERRLGKRMRIDAEKERPIDFLLVPVQANRLSDREDMRIR